MGCAIQFESHRDELPFVYLMDHDPQVLEFYDQPYGQLKLKYRNQDDTRNVTATHTPDFFVLREDGAGWGIPPAPATPLMVTLGGIGEKYAVTDGQIALREYLLISAEASKVC